MIRPTEGFAQRLVEYRVWVLVGIGLVVGLLAIPLKDLRIGYSVATFLKTDDAELREAVRHYEDFEVPDDLILFGYAEPDPYAEIAQRRVADLDRALSALDGVAAVFTIASAPGVAGDMATQRERVRASRTWRRLLVGRSEQALGGVIRLRDEFPATVFSAIEEVSAALGCELYMTGVPYHREKSIEMIRKDQALFLPLATTITIALLLWLIPNLVLALISMLVIPLSLVATFGTMVLLGGELTLLTSILPTILMSLAVADGVHLVGRFREERLGGQEPEAAAVTSFRELFGPCLLTSATTAIGFLSLSFADMPDLRNLGIFAAIGVGYAFVFTVLVMPAVLSFVGVEPKRHRVDVQGQIVNLTRFVARAPVGWVLGPAALLLSAAAAAGSLVENDHTLTDDLWPDSDIVRQLRAYEREFVSMAPGEVVVRCAEGFGSPERRAQFAAMIQGIEAFPAVDRTLSIDDLLADGMAPQILAFAAAQGMVPGGLIDAEGTTARVLVFLQDLGSVEFLQFLGLIDELNQSYTDFEVRAAGVQVFSHALVERLVRDLSVSFVSSLGLILILVALWFRSLRLGLAALIPNLVPLVIVLGLMGLMGITLRPLTVISFCIAFGLAVDDAVHLLARYLEERQLGLSSGQAIDRTLATAGRPIVVTTLLLLTGFTTILGSAFKGTHEFGLLVVVALLGSLCGALFVLPAMLRVRNR